MPTTLLVAVKHNMTAGFSLQCICSTVCWYKQVHGAGKPSGCCNKTQTHQREMYEVCGGPMYLQIRKTSTKLRGCLRHKMICKSSAGGLLKSSRSLDDKRLVLAHPGVPGRSAAKCFEFHIDTRFASQNILLVNPLKCSGVRQLHLKCSVPSRSNLHFLFLTFGHSGAQG